MPTYVYACTSCGDRLEAVQRITDDPLTICPACSGALRKVIQPVGIVFKGSGFYKTDSRGSANGSRSDSADSGGGADKATEKPAEKVPAPAGAADKSTADKAASKPSGSASKPPPSSGAAPGTTKRAAAKTDAA